MNFDWHMLYPLHIVILDNSRDFRGVPCRAQLCNFSKWFFQPPFWGGTHLGTVAILVRA